MTKKNVKTSVKSQDMIKQKNLIKTQIQDIAVPCQQLPKFSISITFNGYYPFTTDFP